MPLSQITPKIITFTGKTSMTSPKEDKRKEKVGEAAVVTGGVGAGCSATRSAAFKMFKSSEKLNQVVNGTARGTAALAQPVQQTRSLKNAFHLNYQRITQAIVRWANNSNMPNFLKSIFNGKMAGIIGGGASVFVFVTGLAQVFSTFLTNVQGLPFVSQNNKN